MSETGIEGLKKSLKRVLNFGLALSKDLEDGKITLGEGIGLIGKIVPLGYIINNWAQIKAEYMDLSVEERAEMQSYLASEFDIDNDRIEKIIEDGFGMLLVVDTFVRNFVK